jgi:hypothetical protein
VLTTPPPLPILAPAHAPPAPVVPTECAQPVPQAQAIHHPGACVILKQLLDGPETWRTLLSWSSGVLVAQQTEHWEAWDPNATGWCEYERRVENFTVASDGQPVRDDWLYQSVVPYQNAADSQTVAGITQFAYDASRRLTASFLTNWGHYTAQAPARYTQNDGYLVDAAGKTFHISSTDPYTPLISRYSLDPNGVVSTDYSTSTVMGHTGEIQKFYDPQGVVQRAEMTVTDRFGRVTRGTTQYQYADGRLASVDTTWDDGTGSSVAYHYDSAGNNVERVTTSRGGGVARWTGVYDSGGNLACEKDETYGTVTQYDYGCF